MRRTVLKQSVLPMHPVLLEELEELEEEMEEELALDSLPRGVPSLLHLQQLLPIQLDKQKLPRPIHLLPRMTV